MIWDCTTVLVTIMDNKYNMYMYTGMHVMQLPEPMFYFEFIQQYNFIFSTSLEKELKIQKYFFSYKRNFQKQKMCIDIYNPIYFA